MESNKIEILIEKYFEGETSIAEEKELTNYFTSSDVAQHLEQYQPLFSYFSNAKEQKFAQEIPLQSKKRSVAWLSIAASVVVLLGIGMYTFVNTNTTTASQDLGSFNDPQVAIQETQKALAMLSGHVNSGVESVQYIQEFEIAKEKVFVK